MKETIYLDVYFMLNFLMDGASLLTAGLILSERPRTLSLLAASAAGAGFSVLMLILFPPPPLQLISAMGMFVLMVRLAYGKKSPRRIGKLALFAFLAALFLGGASEWISYYSSCGKEARLTPITLAAVVLLALGCFVGWGRHLKKKLETSVIALSVCHGGKREELFGLVDSGSFLREPESGAPVILMKAEYASSVLSAGELVRLRLGEGEGVFPIPMRTASGTGCLFAFFPQRVLLHGGGKKKSKVFAGTVPVAVDFSGGGYGGCPCLIPLALV
ncbi:MAG: sigma-E processing peptidase SpoIIGA [Clostridia bacterium]|nr:sigma-E processing peptidase SpoIIGA [Clostridia bacterium]